MANADEESYYEKESPWTFAPVVAFVSAGAALFGYILGRGVFEKEVVQTAVNLAEGWCGPRRPPRSGEAP